MSTSRNIADDHYRAIAKRWSAPRSLPRMLRPLLHGAIVMVFGWSEYALAQPFPQVVQPNGTVITLPANGKVSRDSGLTLEVDTRWADSYGYRPLEFVFRSAQPTTLARTIKIQLHIGWLGPGSRLTVEREFEFAAGSTSLSAKISVPIYRVSGQLYWWDIWVDGKKENLLSLGRMESASIPGALVQSNGNGASILVVGPKQRRRQLMAPQTYEFEVFSLPEDEFPDNWRDYTSFDLVALSLEEMRGILRDQPARFEALRKWGQSGGQIWIGDVGAEWKDLDEVAKAFGLSGPLPSEHTANEQDGSSPSADDDDEPLQLGWRAIPFRRFRMGDDVNGVSITFENLLTKERRVAQDPAEIVQLRQNPDYIVVNTEMPEFGPGRPGRMAMGMDGFDGAIPDADSTEPLGSMAPDERQDNEPLGRRRRGRRLPRDSSEWFVDHALAFGSVRAFQGSWDLAAMASPPDASGQIGPPMDRMPPSTRMAFQSTRSWTERHGLAPDESNPDFADLLVPGLGLAPVTEFSVLITLFVLLIGPFNYWILKRLGRLHLLVLTVPLAAGCLTIGLFAYAMLMDGFGTAVRVRSYTMLNQRTGDAVCWARLSYYSGLAPSDGLKFPSDLAIYPIPPNWQNARYDHYDSISREAKWGAAEDHYTRGWLSSRTPTQYLTVRARKSPHRIVFDQAGERLRATNELGTAVHYLAAIDGAGQYFEGKNLDAGARRFLTPVTRNEAIRSIRQQILTHQLDTPPALSMDFMWVGARAPSSYSIRRGGYDSSRLAENLLEMSIGDLGGMNGPAPLRLGPRSYVAITKAGPEVALGHSGIEEQASFHVLVGEW